MAKHYLVFIIDTFLRDTSGRKNCEQQISKSGCDQGFYQTILCSSHHYQLF